MSPTPFLLSFRVGFETRLTLAFVFSRFAVDLLLRACDEVGTVLDLKHGKPEGGKWKVEDVIAKATELVLS